MKIDYKTKTILTVDPSINTCGVAVYKKAKLVFHDLIKPVIDKGKKIDLSQTVKTDKKTVDYVDKSKSVYRQVKKLYEEYEPDIVVVEVPEYFGTGGYLSRESGSMFKLTFVAGMLMTLPFSFAVNPRVWKGQLNKTVVQNRLHLLYPKLDILGMDHNICDAIAIGHWILYGKVG